MILGKLSGVKLGSSGCGSVVVDGTGEEDTDGKLPVVLLGLSNGDAVGVGVVMPSEIHVDPSSIGFNRSNEVGGTRWKSQLTHRDS